MSCSWIVYAPPPEHWLRASVSLVPKLLNASGPAESRLITVLPIDLKVAGWVWLKAADP